MLPTIKEIIFSSLRNSVNGKSQKMKRKDAREYFKSKKLEYADITEEDIVKLSQFVSKELATYQESGGEHASLMGMQVSEIRKKDIKISKEKGLQYARIQIDGSYFERREGITFHSAGFIGFGESLSDKNVQPIIIAFCKWCDVISN